MDKCLKSTNGTDTARGFPPEPPAIGKARSFWKEALGITGNLAALLVLLFTACQTHKPAVVTHISLFDFYRGKGIAEGRKSLAFRIVMQDTGRTLTDAEADAARDRIVALLRENFGGELR